MRRSAENAISVSSLNDEFDRMVSRQLAFLAGDCSLKTEEWLTADEAAAYLKVAVGALRNMTSNGQIPFHKLGRRNRYRLEDLRNLLLSQRRGVLNGN